MKRLTFLVVMVMVAQAAVGLRLSQGAFKDHMNTTIQG